MRYEIKGETLPVVVCYLEDGEQMITERGSMSWMSPNMMMDTNARVYFSEHLHSNPRKWNDCFCVQLSRINQGF